MKAQIKYSVTHLHHFLYSLPALPFKRDLVILCIDAPCLAYSQMQSVRKENWYSYGGYRFNKPGMLRNSTWPKLQGGLLL